jgi:hypothetical protein
VRCQSSPGFYIYIFLVPKKLGEWRLIIDLSRLNCFLIVPRFKMETTRSVAAAIQPKDWAVSLDVQDAYFHILMHPDYWHFLRFCHGGKVYQFQALPFGVASAPLILTTVVQAFVAPFHALGLKLHFWPACGEPMQSHGSRAIYTSIALLFKGLIHQFFEAIHLGANWAKIR